MSLIILWRCTVSLLRFAMSLIIVLRFAMSLAVLPRCAVSLTILWSRAMSLAVVRSCAMSLTILWSCAVSLLRCAISLNISLTSLLNRVHHVYIPSVLRPCIASSCLLSHANWNRRSRVIKSSRMDPFKQLGCRAVQQQHQMEECGLERMRESQNAKPTRNLCSESTPLSRHSLPCFPLGLAASVR